MGDHVRVTVIATGFERGEERPVARLAAGTRQPNGGTRPERPARPAPERGARVRGAARRARDPELPARGLTEDDDRHAPSGAGARGRSGHPVTLASIGLAVILLVVGPRLMAVIRRRAAREVLAASTLADAGYVTIDQPLAGQRRRVRARLTATGRAAYGGHVAALHAIVGPPPS